MEFNLKKISNYLMNIGIGMSLLSLVKLYLDKKSMPARTCPIDANNKLLYMSMGLCLLGVLISFIKTKESKKV